MVEWSLHQSPSFFSRFLTPVWFLSFAKDAAVGWDVWAVCGNGKAAAAKGEQAYAAATLDGVAGELAKEAAGH